MHHSFSMNKMLIGSNDNNENEQVLELSSIKVWVQNWCSLKLQWSDKLRFYWFCCCCVIWRGKSSTAASLSNNIMSTACSEVCMNLKKHFNWPALLILIVSIMPEYRSWRQQSSRSNSWKILNWWRKTF